MIFANLQWKYCGYGIWLSYVRFFHQYIYINNIYGYPNVDKDYSQKPFNRTVGTRQRIGNDFFALLIVINIFDGFC